MILIILVNSNNTTCNTKKMHYLNCKLYIVEGVHVNVKMQKKKKL